MVRGRFIMFASALVVLIVAAPAQGAERWAAPRALTPQGAFPFCPSADRSHAGTVGWTTADEEGPPTSLLDDPFRGPGPTPLGGDIICPAVATGPDGRSVVAFTRPVGRQTVVEVADVGSDGSVTGRQRLGDGVDPVTVAAGPGGAAAVGWMVENVTRLDDEDLDEDALLALESGRALVAVRDAGATTFAAPQELTDRASLAGPPAVAQAPDGTTVAVFLRDREDFFTEVVAVRRTPGGRFDGEQVLLRDGGLSVPAVAAGPAGVVVAAASPRGMQVFAAAPGESLRRLGRGSRPASERFVGTPAIVLSPDGAATVAWHELSTEGFGDGVDPSGVLRVLERTAGAERFGAARVMARRTSSFGEPPALAAGPGGDAVLAWVRAPRSRATTFRAVASLGRPGGPWQAPAIVSPRTRQASEVAATVDPLGRPAVLATLGGAVSGTVEPIAGSLDIITREAVPAADDRRAPALTVDARTARVEDRAVVLPLTVSCDAPCDVRAVARVRRGGALIGVGEFEAARRFEAPGRERLTTVSEPLSRRAARALRSDGSTRIEVTVEATDPRGALSSERRTVRLRER